MEKNYMIKDDHEGKVIACCGNNCAACPRYYLNSPEEIQNGAKLWQKLGLEKELLSLEDARCYGCLFHKECRYQLTDCIKSRGFQSCEECLIYPCEKIREILQESLRFKKICEGNCSKEEYQLLKKIFFEKAGNLQKRKNSQHLKKEGEMIDILY